MKTKLFALTAILCVSVALLWAGASEAQDQPPYECDDNFGECGTPQQSGGGCGCGGGSILINNTDLGDTYQYADDYDDDGHEDPFDNCPFVPNRDQADDDGDLVGTGCDNCPNDANEDQSDIDGDGTGDACDGDKDGDGVANGGDLCPTVPDPEQEDADKDGQGDACDEDMDGDGVNNLEDNCPLVPNPGQADDDPGKFGDACDKDADGDGIRDVSDNCRSVSNYEQDDEDEDGMGDICDFDMDGDGIANRLDNCQLLGNADQLDLDRDGLGDGCDDVYCYVVMGDVENCLNPNDAFKIYSPNLTANTGDTVRMRLFANRVNQPMRYTWTVTKAPSSSSATIDNPIGAASISTPYEYHYLQDRVVTFVPDKPGRYEIRVRAELVWDDDITGESGVQAETYSIIDAQGEPLDSGACSTAPIGRGAHIWSALAAMALLALGLVLARRRS